MASPRRPVRRGASRETEGKESLQLDREAVRHWRLQAGFTQEALSRQHAQIDGERVQISYAQLRRIEREGRAGPGTARILAALLGVELAQLRPRDPRAQPCGLPREVSVDFVGRRAELTAVLEVLQRAGNVRIAASVEGLPGVGKTELALQVCGVCERSRAFRIFWLHAEQPDLTPQWAGPVAQHLGIEHPEERERARLVLRKLESLGEPTLIVLDNVERWSASEPWPRPQGRHLRWLVTTRASQLGDRAFEHVEVPVLDEASARELFARIAGLEVCERPGFAELIQHLDGYTIAIELAAAFLGRFPEVDPAEYLKLLSAGKADLLEDEVRERTPYQQTLDASLELLWQRVPAATRALWLRGACFTQDSAGPELSQACGLDRRACAQLRDFHLIQREPRGWTMHRLLRAYALRRAAEPDLARARAALVKGSAACLSPTSRVSGLSLYVNNRAHLELALSLAESLSSELEAELADLSWIIGRIRLSLGVHADSGPLFERAVRYFRERLQRTARERDPLGYARMQDRLARALLAQCSWKYDAAELAHVIHAAAEAMGAFDREKTPVEWANARRVYATGVEVRMNRGGGEPSEIDCAVEGLIAALGVYTREADPLEWARTQAQIGSLLTERCYYTYSIAYAPQAEAAAARAAQVLSRESHPWEWARLHQRWGALLIIWCDRTGDISFGERAVQLLRNVLELAGPEETPRLWWSWQHTLSLALFSTAACAEGTEQLEDALRAVQAAAKALDEKGTFLDVLTILTRALLLRVLGRRTTGTEALAESIELGRRAVETIKRDERYGNYWVPGQGSLGVALALYGQRTGCVSDAKEGVELCRAALAASADENATKRAERQLELGEALAALGRSSGEFSYLSEAHRYFQLSREVLVSTSPQDARWIEQQLQDLERELVSRPT